jgi:transcriptional regulator with XRE-family HTH domain
VKTFASELERRRLALAVSQEELAAKADVSRSTVQNAEKGMAVSPRSVRRLATFLNWPLDEAMKLATGATPAEPRLTIIGPLAGKIRDGANQAKQPVNAFLAALLDQAPKPKGKR